MHVDCRRRCQGDAPGASHSIRVPLYGIPPSAWAHAVTPNPHCVTQQVNPRMLFATHYHPLNAETAGDPGIQQGHMAALVGAQRDTGAAAAVVGGGGGSRPGSGVDGITFLYQLRQGPCDKSYGLLVSSLPAELLSEAQQLAGMAKY